MNLLDSIRRMMCSFRAVLGLSGKSRPAPVLALGEVPAAIASAQPMVPAVAGFVWRLAVDRFMLAKRLASIARLNTPVGRKPRGSLSRFRGLPPIPAARLGAKKTRLQANVGPRVLVPTATQRPSATIIPFPRARIRQNPSTALARAA